MRAALITLLFIAVCVPTLAEEKPELVKVYCSSEDLESGFKDGTGEFFCRELGKQGKKKESLTLTGDRSKADAIVMYLGTEEITAKGEATYLLGGYVWTPDQTKNGARVIVTIGDFTKGFHATGINDAGPKGAMRKLETWIRENREAILEK